MASTWCIQFRAFLLKLLVQLVKTPVITVLTLLLPSVVMTVLFIGYRTSTVTHVQQTNYADRPITNVSKLFEAHFCKNHTAPREFSDRLPIPTCNAMSDAVECLSFVHNSALCVQNVSVAWDAVGELLKVSGPVVVPTLNAYLALSAFVTYELRRKNPNFFARSAAESMAHYGRLILVGRNAEDRELAAKFTKFCTNASVLCGEVLDDETVFSSMDAAHQHAVDNDGEVWAVAELSGDDAEVQSRGEQGRQFTISMNYSATPWTTMSTLPLTKSLEENGNLLYITSGFLTLQNLIQQFYVHTRAGPEKQSEIFDYVNLYGPTLLAMPSPSYLKGSFYKWGQFLPLLSAFAALLAGVRLLNWVVGEKHLMIRECMSVMGLRWSPMALGWFTVALLMDMIASLPASLLMYGSFFSYVTPGVLFVVHLSLLQHTTALCLLLSSFFRGPRRAILTFFMISGACIIPFCTLPREVHAVRLRLLCLLPYIGYFVSFEGLIQYASRQQKFYWRNAFDGEGCVASFVCMTWVSTLVMLLLWVYFDQILPRSSYCSKNPLFFVNKLRRLLRRSQAPKREQYVHPWRTASKDEIPASMRLLMQQCPQSVDDNDGAVAAVLYGLSKNYIKRGSWFQCLCPCAKGMPREDNLACVSDASCLLEFGKVNVVIGPSGCGMSTLLRMAVGIVKPDSGVVHICGRSFQDEPDECRKSIGYCPQVDILWDDLTVEQHLSLYARMKYKGAWDVQETVNDLIETLNLGKQRLSAARKLTGCQRRRLCVGIAIVGDPAVVFLDDPTAGMDIKGRAAVYAALNSGREGRAVLITTHELDEADRIGDCIHIMRNGTVCDSGTSLTLKSRMDVGYTLTCVVSADLTPGEASVSLDRLVSLMRSGDFLTLDAASGRESRSVSQSCRVLGIERRGRQVSFRFPLSLLSSEGVNLFSRLEACREELHLQSIGLSIATLQDVLDYFTTDKNPVEVISRDGDGACSDKAHAMADDFPNGGGECSHVVAAVNLLDDENNGNANTQTCLENGMPASALPASREARGTFRPHLTALFWKKVYCGKRDTQLKIYYVLLPLVLVLISLFVSNVKPTVQHAITLDASLYHMQDKTPNSTVLWTYSQVLDDAFRVRADNLSDALGPHRVPMLVGCYRKACSNVLSDALFRRLEGGVSGEHIALALTSIDNGVPSSVILHNFSSPHAAGESLNALYDVVNNRLFGKGVRITARNGPMPMGPHEKEMLSAFRRIIGCLVITVAFIILPANIVYRLVQEVQRGSYHLQRLAGANMISFWVSSMIFDFTCYLVMEVLVLLVLFASKRDDLVGNLHTAAATVTLFTLYGPAHIVFSYFLSFFFSCPLKAHNTVLIGSLLLGVLWVLVEPMSVRSGRMVTLVMNITYVLRICPCVAFSEALLALACTSLANIRKPHREWPNVFSFLRYNENGLVGGVGTGLLYMGCTFFAYLFLVLAMERLRQSGYACCCLPGIGGDGDTNRNFTACRGERGHKRRRQAGSAGENCRTEEEMLPCRHEVPGNESDLAVDGIMLQHVTKRYRGNPFLALHDVSLTVRRGEALAVLGLNGAGKTTILSILAGRLSSTTGSVYINGTPVMPNIRRRDVGYCPQEDALIDKLTPYEHLRLFSKLRGSTDAQTNTEIPELLRVLDLVGVENHAVSTLNAGSRRRVSLAVALVGGTSFLLLDEPTSNMDVVTRRQICVAMRELRETRTILMATHHLGEMEILADYTAFMESGQLRHVGTPQELKTYFTNDTQYTVRVMFGSTVQPALHPQGDVVSKLCEFFSFPLGPKTCHIRSVSGRTVTLSVACSLLHLCKQVAAVREGTAAGLPQVVQVCATQPQLDDILLTC